MNTKNPQEQPEASIELGSTDWFSAGGEGLEWFLIVVGCSMLAFMVAVIACWMKDHGQRDVDDWTDDNY